jgi:hypothetical protein
MALIGLAGGTIGATLHTKRYDQKTFVDTDGLDAAAAVNQSSPPVVDDQGHQCRAPAPAYSGAASK